MKDTTEGVTLGKAQLALSNEKTRKGGIHAIMLHLLLLRHQHCPSP